MRSGYQPTGTAVWSATASSADGTALSKAQHERGENNDWRGSNGIGSDRKQIGDFACWIHATLALEHLHGSPDRAALKQNEAYGLFLSMKKADAEAERESVYREAIRLAHSLARTRLGLPESGRRMPQIPGVDTSGQEMFEEAIRVLVYARRNDAEEPSRWNEMMSSSALLSDYACYLHAFLAIEAR